MKNTELTEEEQKEMIDMVNIFDPKVILPITCYLMIKNDNYYLVPQGNAIATIGILPVNKLNKGEV